MEDCGSKFASILEEVALNLGLHLFCSFERIWKNSNYVPILAIASSAGAGTGLQLPDSRKRQ
eukprot:3704183-Amphidinium_carterae.1